MEQMVEIKWIARAGQGAVSAAQAVAQTVGSTGKCVQAYPDFGAEKRGAPLAAYNRISDRPIRTHSNVERPGIVLVLDTTLLDIVDPAEGTPESGILIFNSPEPPAKIRKRLKIEGRKLFSVDATKIAVEEIGRNIPNFPMIGALVRATGLVGEEDLLERAREVMSGHFSEKIVEGNVRAAARGLKEVLGEDAGAGNGQGVVA